DGMTDEQAGMRSTVSALCLGGIVKHVGDVEAAWTAFIAGGADAMDAEAARQDREASFAMQPGDTVAGVLAHYEQIAAATDQLVGGLSDLDAAHPLPSAPWFEAGASWSARRVVVHILGETAHHAGHADIIRESIDGAKTMG
ncbi:MAG: DinB family protein, partial [Acidimicrobiia bacterium]